MVLLLLALDPRSCDRCWLCLCVFVSRGGCGVLLAWCSFCGLALLVAWSALAWCCELLTLPSMPTRPVFAMSSIVHGRHR